MEDLKSIEDEAFVGEGFDLGVDLGRLVDGEKNITEWVRDEQGRVTAKRYADASELSYEYDCSGRLASETNARGQVKTFEYFLDDALKSVFSRVPARSAHDSILSRKGASENPGAIQAS